MAARSGKNGNISPLHGTLLFKPAGQKFARNCSIGFTVFEIFVIFHISTKSSNKVAIIHLYIEQQL